MHDCNNSSVLLVPSQVEGGGVWGVVVDVGQEEEV